MQSFMLTEDIARRAVQMVEPMRVAAAESGVLKRTDGHVVIVDMLSPLNGEVLVPIYEQSFGPSGEKWEHDYLAHARYKAGICRRTGVSSRQAIHLMPWWLVIGDSPWEGGIVLDGIIVAYSGAAAEHDEAIAYAVMGWVRAFCFTQAAETGLWTPERQNIGA